MPDFVSTPTVTCLHLTPDELAQRRAITQEVAANLVEEHADNPSAARVNEVLIWHTGFPAGFLAKLAALPLYEVSAYLQNRFADKGIYYFIDFCYLADLLREALADYPAPPAACRWRRALAWVKQEGAARYVEATQKGGRDE